MTDKRTWAAILVLVVSAVLFGLGLVRKEWRAPEPGSGRNRMLTVIPKGTSSMWWEVVHKGAADAARELGYELSWTGPELESDRDRQIQVVEDAVTKGSAAIVLAPNDGKALIRPVEKIKAADLPCVLIDSALEREVADSLVATDNRAGGAEAARLLGRALGGRGRVILVKFIQNSISTDQRAEGFRDTLRAEFPGIEILDEQFTTGSAEDAIQRTEDMLTRHAGKVDGVFAVNQPTAIGAYKALENLDLAGKIQYVGFDSDPCLLQPIADGKILALLVQNPYQIGYQGVQMADRRLRGEAVPRNQTVDTMTVTRENLETMKKEFPAALGI